jgi:hypothetical protein
MHMKTLTPEILPQAIRGTFIEFDEAVRSRLENYSDSYIENWCRPEAAQEDLARLYQDCIRDIKTMLNAEDIPLTDKRIFDLFHIMAMKLALRAHKDPCVLEILGLN